MVSAPRSRSANRLSTHRTLPSLGAQHHGVIWRILKAARRLVLPLLPASRAVEILTAHLEYAIVHRRLLIGDRHRRFTRYLFYLRTSGELYDPLRQFVTDKEHAKQYVTAKIGDRYNVPTLLVTSSVDEACAFKSHERVVAKPTHLSGAKSVLDAGESLPPDLVRKWLSSSFYPLSREGNYRYLARKIILEPCLVENGHAPLDYKFYCFSGIPKFVGVFRWEDRFEGRTTRFYQRDWSPLDFLMSFSMGTPVEAPANIEEMFWVAEELSRPFDAIRVDLYSCNGRVYIGELTNCDGGGRFEFRPTIVDEIVGAFLQRPDLAAGEAFRPLR